MPLSTKEQEKLKDALINKKSEIESELVKFATKDENGAFKADFPEDLGTEQSENANEVEEYTNRLALEKTLETELKDIDDALAKMEDGTYGKDEKTGKDIKEERLKAYPAARTNIE